MSLPELPIFEHYVRTRGPTLTLVEYMIALGMAAAESIMVIQAREIAKQTWASEVYQAWEDPLELGRPMLPPSVPPPSA